MTRRTHRAVAWVGELALSCALLPIVAAAQDRGTPDLSAVPGVVMEALNASFPHAAVQQWTREDDEGVTVYDFEFTIDGRKFEADIKGDGTIHNWERAIPAADLPSIVKAAVNTRYPKATLKEVMEVTAVSEGQEALEGFEVLLEGADGTESELTVAPDGKILEDSRDEG